MVQDIETVLMKGEDAVARGAVEAGVRVTTSYPGAPVSGILPGIASMGDKLGISAKWSTNEKVACEIAFGGSLAGVRSMAVVKNVGVNVAQDPFMIISYVGCNAGLVFVWGDDPAGLGSSTEQDDRFVARTAEVLMLEPTNPQEAKDMTIEAFKLSEELSLPVVLRLTTRVCDMRAPVRFGRISTSAQPAFKDSPWSWTTGCGTTVSRHKWLHEKQSKIREIVEESRFNKLETKGGERIGIIAAGMGYNYARDAVEELHLWNDVALLKIGTYPIPENMVKRIMDSVEKILVVEELEPFIELHVKALRSSNIEIRGKSTLDIPEVGELSPTLVMNALAKMAGNEFEVKKAFSGNAVEEVYRSLPQRVPTLCAGCPHMMSLFELRKAAEEAGRGVYVAPADAGCSGLRALYPYKTLHVSTSMGSSIGIASGMIRAGLKEPVIAVIGDSAFYHTGMPALVDAVWHGMNVLVLICDNQIVAMTGRQHSPTSVGPLHLIPIDDAVRGCGVKFVEAIDPFNVELSIDVMRKGIEYNGPAVVVSRRPCTIGKALGEPYQVIEGICVGCKTCSHQLGCVAIGWRNGKAFVDPLICIGCGFCAKLCPVKAISRVAVK